MQLKMQNRLSVSHVNDSLCDAGCMLLMSTAIPTSPYLSCCMVSKPSNCLRKYSYCSHSSIRQELTCFAASAVVQFLFSPVLLHGNMLSTIISVALYVAALSYYHYLNFLGYSALPFLDHTEVRQQFAGEYMPMFTISRP